MDKSGIVALLLIAGYFGVEIYAVSTQRHKTEPTYIHDRYTAAARAVALCGPLRDLNQPRITRNREVVRGQAERQLAQANPEQPPEYIAALLAARESAKTEEVDALHESEGCEAKALWHMRKAYEQIANLRLK